MDGIQLLRPPDNRRQHARGSLCVEEKRRGDEKRALGRGENSKELLLVGPSEVRTKNVSISSAPLDRMLLIILTMSSSKSSVGSEMTGANEEAGKDALRIKKQPNDYNNYDVEPNSPTSSRPHDNEQHQSPTHIADDEKNAHLVDVHPTLDPTPVIL
ncbi:hypothetical protein K2173_012563 [Erythroxylum novogranatense]|uniref:Uncharacterized protein n=1 Tax=Erythroxylum novogranatense TaxID=1862640 RepID=A0AAV8TJI1_9ROSI|nr:hypothetical protein K2173_012563 [Erythroxylum novogranatense]